MDIYSLSRQFFDWTYENTDLAKPNHIALYFFIIEHNNRLGWKEKFGLPSSMAKEAIGIKSYNTYIETFKDLAKWGFIKVVQESKNQFSSTIISITKPKNAISKNKSALDKALIKHGTKHKESTVQSTGESIDSIDIQVYNNTNLPINNSSFKKEAKENLSNSEIVHVEIPPQTTDEKLDAGQVPNFTSKGQIQEKEKSSAKKEKDGIDFSFCEHSPLKAILIRWLNYKKWKGQRYKGQDSIETMFKKLNEYSRGDPGVALEIIEDAIARNYSGFFKPTNKFTNDTNSNNQTGTNDFIGRIPISEVASFHGKSTDELLGSTSNAG